MGHWTCDLISPAACVRNANRIKDRSFACHKPPVKCLAKFVTHGEWMHFGLIRTSCRKFGAQQKTEFINAINIDVGTILCARLQEHRLSYNWFATGTHRPSAS
jgi:hypothetical protein